METSVGCLPVVYDEGLRSYKAIAFIESLILYFELGATPQPSVLSRQKPLDTSLKI